MESYIDYNKISKALHSVYDILNEDKASSAEARASILEAEQTLHNAMKYSNLRNQAITYKNASD